MRKVIFTFGLLAIFAGMNGQKAGNGFLLSGEVIYQEIVHLDIQLEGVDAQIAEQLPKERKTEKVLHFTENEAMFETLQKDDPEEHMPMEGGGMMIRMYEPDDKTYMDLAGKKLIEQKEFMTRVFLIESELEPESWKITGEQRKILDYACQEAVAQVDGHDVHAWFTPQIAVGVGPGPYTGLPGLVLAVESAEGNRKLEATQVTLKPIEDGVIKKPGKGKKVSQEEYHAIVAEKLKEMGVEGDGTWNDDGGANHTSTVVIRIQQ
jgi:GLPGLI family protein